MADNLRKYTTQEVLNKVYTDSSGITIGLNSQSSKETLNAVLDSSNNRLQVAMAGGTISGDVTISGDLTVEGDSYANVSETVQGDMIITSSSSSDSKPLFQIINTDTSNNYGGELQFYKNASAGSDNDQLGKILFYGNNDAGTPEKTSFASIFAYSADVSDGTEDGWLRIRTIANGTNTDTLTMKSGKVGIGTTSPVYGLDVRSTGYFATASSFNQLTLGDTSNGTTSSFNTTNNALAFKYNGSATGMTLTSSGLGIGTTSPLQPLHLKVNNNNSDPHFFIENANNGGRSHARFWNSSRNTYWSFGQQNDDSFVFANTSSISSSQKFIIDSNSRISLSNNDSGTSNTVFGKNAGASLDAGSNYNVFVGENVSDASMNDASYNTAVGYSSLSALTEGDSNDALGYNSLLSLTTGSSNTALGRDTLRTSTIGASNVAIGQSSMYALTSGGNNVGVGSGSLYSNETGQYNTAVGIQALSGASGQSHSNNTATGYKSLFAITTGEDNVAIGSNALDALTDGDRNVAIGKEALTAYTGSGATYQVAVGHRAGYNRTGGAQNTTLGALSQFGGTSGTAPTGAGNTSVGYSSLHNLTSGAYNAGFGVQSGYNNKTGIYNHSFGYQAGYYNETGSNNVAVGSQALFGASGQSHSDNTAIGHNALKVATTGSNNVAVGSNALLASTSGIENLAIGRNALAATTTQNRNIALGYFTGASITGSDAIYNVLIGDYSGTGGSGNLKSSIAIGYQALDATGSNNVTGAVAIGYNALTALTSGNGTTAIGYEAGKTLSTGNNNTFLGYQTGKSVTHSNNVAIGTIAFDTASSAEDSVIIGYSAGTGITTGDGNVAIGHEASVTLTTGSNNTIIGRTANVSASGASNQIAIGQGVTCVGDNTAVIGNSSTTKVYMAQDANDSATSQAEGAEILAKSGYFKSIGLDADSGGSADKALLTLHGAYDADVSGTGAQGHGISWIMQDESTNNGETARIASVSRSGNMASNLSGFGSALELWSRNGGTMAKFMACDGNDGRRKTIIYGNNAGSGGGEALLVENDGNDANRDGIKIKIGADDASGTTAYIDAQDGNGDQVGHISNTSGTFALTDVSDKRLKKNIVDTSVKGVETIDKMKVRDFEWIKSGDKMTAGFVAQELAEAFPSAVTGEDGAMEDILDEDGNKTGEKIKPMGVSRDVLVPVLIKAVQELSAKVKELEAKLSK